MAAERPGSKRTDCGAIHMAYERVQSASAGTDRRSESNPHRLIVCEKQRKYFAVFIT
jgi:hypothetical protein